MRRALLLLSLPLFACGNSIDKGPKTVYVVVNNTSGENAQTNGSTNGMQNNTVGPNGNTNVAMTNNAPLNNPPANIAVNNTSTNNNTTPVNNTSTNNNTTPVNNTSTNNNTTPPNNPTTGNACNNTSDLTAVTTQQTEIIARDCTLQCLGDPDMNGCVADCVEVNAGTSPACSGCIAEFAGCGLNNCFQQCGEDPYTATCISCLQQFCDADFVLCSGIPPR